MFRLIQIETCSGRPGFSDQQEEVIKLIIPDRIFDRHTKIDVTSAVVTECLGNPAGILVPQRLCQQEQR